MEAIEKFIKTLKSMREFNKVEFIILYGSASQGKKIESSDIDICIYYRAKKAEEMSKFRLKLLSKLYSDVYDVQIFQLLPLYVRKEVLKGKLLYARDKKFLNAVALNTVRDFESFKPRFYDYIYR